MSDEKYYAILTDLGQQLITEAYQAGEVVTVTQLAFGDANQTYVAPDPAMTALVSQTDILPLIRGPQVDDIIGGGVDLLSDDYPDSWIYEAGLFDAAGNLIIYASYPPTLIPPSTDSVKKGVSLDIGLVMSATDNITVYVDPKIEALTREVADTLYPQIVNNLSEIAARGAEAQTVARDNLGAVSKSTTVNGHPLSANINVTSQDIFNGQVIGLTADIDLNTLTTPGLYYNPANANATSEHNYPSTNAGSLQVLKDAGVTQIYTEYSGGQQFRRGYYGSAWGEWLHGYDSVHAPPAIDAYTKTESDGRYPLKDGASIIGFDSDNVEKPYFRHATSNTVVRLATISYAYSKAESDERYAAKGTSGSTTTGTTSAYYKHASGQIFMQCISGVASNSNTNPDVTITLPASFANGILAVGASFSGNGGDDVDSWWTVGTSGKNQLNLHTRNCSGTWSFVVTGY